VEPIGTGSVALDGSGDANGGQFRGFYGMQLHLWSARLYGQMNIGIDQTDGAFAVNRAGPTTQGAPSWRFDRSSRTKSWYQYALDLT
jgi:hypothetical protein